MLWLGTCNLFLIQIKSLVVLERFLAKIPLLPQQIFPGSRDDPKQDCTTLKGVDVNYILIIVKQV